MTDRLAGPRRRAAGHPAWGRRRAVLFAAVLAACGGSETPEATDAAGPAAGRQPAAEVTAAPAGLDDWDSRGADELRVARNAAGDAFVVWRTAWYGPHSLWVNRLAAATGAWSGPVTVESTEEDVGQDFDVAIDAAGNATVAWSQDGSGGASQWAARFDATAARWAAPVRLAGEPGRLQLSGNAAGAVHVVYGAGHGRFFDPGTGQWQPEAWIAQTREPSGLAGAAVPVTDPDGNALVVFHQSFMDWSAALGSNHYDRATGRWGQLAPDSPSSFIGPVPGARIFGQLRDLRLTPLAGRDAMAAWLSAEEGVGGGEVRLARFAGDTRSWRWGRVLMTHRFEQQVQLQRIASDAQQRTQLLWTEVEGGQRVLKAVPLLADGTACGRVRTLDGAVGHGAESAELAVDPQGPAIAVWERHGPPGGPALQLNVAMSRYEPATDSWSPAVLLQRGAIAWKPRVSAGGGGQALVAWVQYDEGVGRVKALTLPLTPAPAP